MSGGLEILAMKEDDITKMLAAGVHLGDSNVNFQMEQYVYKVRPDGKGTLRQVLSVQVVEGVCSLAHWYNVLYNIIIEIIIMELCECPMFVYN